MNQLTQNLILFGLSGTLFLSVFTERQIIILILPYIYFYIKVGPRKTLLVCISICLMTLAFSLYLKIKPSMGYYRPQEMMSSNDKRFDFGSIYKPNTRLNMKMPYGDIEAMSGLGIRRARQIRFVTDSLGFRNANNYHGQEYVLIGDSFIVGSGSTQECTMNEQLLSAHGIDTYNLSHPGSLKEYFRKANTFKKLQGDNFKILLFIFEGNDFHRYNLNDESPSAQNNSRTATKNIYERYVNRIRGMPFVFIQNRVARAYNLIRKTDQTSQSDIATIMRLKNNMSVAFFTRYVHKTKRESDYNDNILKYSETLKKLKYQIKHIFFIPTKYRVYHKYIYDSIDGKILPNKQWEHLEAVSKNIGISATNLTDLLVEEAGHLLNENRLVFWPDDTHWNCEGISVATREVAKILHN